MRQESFAESCVGLVGRKPCRGVRRYTLSYPLVEGLSKLWSGTITMAVLYCSSVCFPQEQLITLPTLPSVETGTKSKRAKGGVRGHCCLISRGECHAFIVMFRPRLVHSRVASFHLRSWSLSPIRLLPAESQNQAVSALEDIRTQGTVLTLRKVLSFRRRRSLTMR